MDPSIYRLRLCDVLTLCVIGLLFLGLVMVQSASSSITGTPAWKWNERATKHLIYCVVAFLSYLIVGRLDYRSLCREASRFNPVLWFVALSLFTCIIVLIPHIGMEVNGARRWLPLWKVQLQPSELAKWAVVLFLAWWLATRPVNINRFGGFLMTLVPIGWLCLLVVIQDFGTAALIALCALTMLISGKVKLWHLAVV